MTTAQTFTITTGAEATKAQALFARDALQSQRPRLIALFRELDDQAWAAPTRCTEWSVHEVVRHLCDVTLKWIALLGGEPYANVAPGGIDPRTTPLAWLERSAAETPAQTADVFERASAELLEVVDRRVDSGVSDRIPFAYGDVAWSALVLHLFWDAWLHERDVLLPLGRAHESPEVEARAAAVYGLVMCGAAHVVLGRPLHERVVLEGEAVEVFEIEVRDGVITVRASTDEPSHDALRGPMADVVDSLAGRGPDLPDVLRGPGDRVHRLGVFRRFNLTPPT